MVAVSTRAVRTLVFTSYYPKFPGSIVDLNPTMLDYINTIGVLECISGPHFDTAGLLLALRKG